VASNVVDRDMGFKALLRFTHQLKTEHPHVVVGVTGDRGSAPHRSGEGATVVDIAAVHEFGDPSANIPERSFIRATVDAQAKKYRAYISKGIDQELAQTVRSGSVPTQSLTLKRVGLMVEGDIKKRIAQGIAPPNAPATIARKGSSKPLIDSGQLRASIASELRKGRSS
jgi:phage gpG-like protein